MSLARQQWNAERYVANARFVADLGKAVFDLLDPQAGERILDLGCGDGALTQKFVDAGAQAVGVDASEDMVAAARRLGLDARVMDGYNLTFAAEFDAAFSNAALHWMERDPDAVIHGVYRALKPGGRFVAECGGHGCVAAITVALCATASEFDRAGARSMIPWYFPTPDEYRERLERAGFRVEYLALIPRPTPLPTGMRRWLETFAIPFTNSIAEEHRALFLDRVTEKLRPVLCDSKDNWTADYTRLRFRAVKKALFRQE